MGTALRAPRRGARRRCRRLRSNGRATRWWRGRRVGRHVGRRVSSRSAAGRRARPGSYGVPGPSHVIVVPSPVSHRTAVGLRRDRGRRVRGRPRCGPGLPLRLVDPEPRADPDELAHVGRRRGERLRIEQRQLAVCLAGERRGVDDDGAGLVDDELLVDDDTVAVPADDEVGPADDRIDGGFTDTERDSTAGRARDLEQSTRHRPMPTRRPPRCPTPRRPDEDDRITIGTLCRARSQRRQPTPALRRETGNRRCRVSAASDARITDAFGLDVAYLPDVRVGQRCSRPTVETRR